MNQKESVQFDFKNVSKRKEKTLFGKIQKSNLKLLHKILIKALNLVLFENRKEASSYQNTAAIVPQSFKQQGNKSFCVLESLQTKLY